MSRAPVPFHKPLWTQRRDVRQGFLSYFFLIVFVIVVTIDAQRLDVLMVVGLVAQPTCLELVLNKCRSNTCNQIVFLRARYGSVGTVRNNECVSVTALDDQNGIIVLRSENFRNFQNSGPE